MGSLSALTCFLGTFSTLRRSFRIAAVRALRGIVTISITSASIFPTLVAGMLSLPLPWCE